MIRRNQSGRNHPIVNAAAPPEQLCDLAQTWLDGARHDVPRWAGDSARA